jgi:hypothetical protein
MNKKLEGLKAGLGNGLKFSTTYNHKEWVGNLDDYAFSGDMNLTDENVISKIIPHYFPLSDLTKEIRVEGYNDGKAFVLVELLFDSHNFGFTELFEFTQWINAHVETDTIHQLPCVFILEMIKSKFNTEGLDHSDYIDASESKVYEPKKHESC